MSGGPAEIDWENLPHHGLCLGASVGGFHILARVMLDGDDLYFVGFDELHTFCSDDVVP